MKWQMGRRSGNVEDRRGMGGGMRGMGGRPMMGGFGLLAIILIGWAAGIDPMQMLSMLSQGGGGGTVVDQPVAPSDPQDEAGQFVSVVLADTEDVWTQLFKELGRTYQKPNLVLFSGSVNSACGFAQAAMGPFYCPADQKAYLDTQFFDELSRRFGAPGDFAQAYVIAHEIGHHVQNLLGTSDQLHAARGRVSEVEYNQLSVRLELQADFYAGVWANHAQRTRNILEPGDIEEALNAATQIGDDTLQRETQGRVVPDAFTHGTSEQRVRWFKKGFETGDVAQGDTFKASDL